MVVMGLLIQATAFVLVVTRLRRSVLTHIGALFILMAILYHGVSEILIWLFPGHDIYRTWVSPALVGQFVVWISVAILIVSLAYLWVVGPPRLVHGSGKDASETARFFDWRLMSLVAIPLAVLTLHGTGAFSAITGATSLSAGLAQQYFVLVLVLAGFGIVLRFGPRWMVPVLAIAAGLAAFSGERSVALWVAVMLLYAFSRFGIRISRRGIIAAIAVFVLLALVITSARAQEGRYTIGGTGGVRVSYLWAGVTHLVSRATANKIASNLGYRFDGNSFGAMELAAISSGEPTLGLTPLENDLFVAIPSFLNRNKDSSNIGTRQEMIYAEQQFGLTQFEPSPGYWENGIPTELGVTIGYFGPMGLMLIALLLGLAFGFADRWLLRGVSPTRILVGLGLLYCVMDYEGTWDTYLLTARGIILLLLLAWSFQGVRALGRRLAERSAVTVQ